MGHFQSLRRRLRAQLDSKRGRRWLAGLRDRQVSFNQLEQTEEIFESRNLSKSAMDVRDSILRALLAECRTGPDPELAHSFLIALYDPLLRRTSAQLQRTSWGRALEPDDIEAETVARFVELLATMNLETNRDIHTSLVRRLPGQIVDWAENQFLERHHLSERDSDENIGDSTVWFATALPRRRRDGWELDLVELVLAELQARGVIDDETRQLLVGKVILQQSLIQLSAPANSNVELVAANSNRVEPAPGFRRRRSYESTKKRLQRARARIRAYLAGSGLTLLDLAEAAAEKNTAKKSEEKLSPPSETSGEE